MSINRQQEEPPTEEVNFNQHSDLNGTNFSLAYEKKVAEKQGYSKDYLKVMEAGPKVVEGICTITHHLFSIIYLLVCFFGTLPVG